MKNRLPRLLCTTFVSGLTLVIGIPSSGMVSLASAANPSLQGAATAEYYPAHTTTAVRGVHNMAAVDAYSATVIGSASPSGSASRTKTSGQPGAPTITGATSGVGSATVTWTAPTNTGTSPIRSYVVQYAVSGTTLWTTASSSVTTLSYTVTNLLATKSYIFEVAATNNSGTGAFSAPSSAVTPTATAPATPGAPTGVAGNASVTVSWSAPANNGATITSYTVQYSSDSGATWTTASATITTTSYTVGSLTNGTAYVFHVLATNAIGSSAYSAASASVTPAGTTNNGISYHNGPVMTNAINVYEIWYGNWTAASSRQTLIDTFLRGVGGTPYFNINSTYTNGSGTKVNTTVSVAGSTTVSSTTTSLTQSNITTIVSNALSTNALPVDANGLYFVFTSSGVSVQGFLTSFCGYHTYGTMSGQSIKYSFVGDATASPSACVSGLLSSTSSPNNDYIGDGMVSVIVHELEETATDPLLNAWYDSTGAENGDKCAWNFGTTMTAGNGAKANVTWNTTIGGVTTQYWYLIQQNWVNAGGGYCALSY